MSQATIWCLLLSLGMTCQGRDNFFWTSSDFDVTVCVGGVAIFPWTCHIDPETTILTLWDFIPDVTSTPPLRIGVYNKQRQQMELVDDYRDRVQRISEAGFILNRVTLSDMGIYRVTLSLAGGTFTYREARLQVVSKTLSEPVSSNQCKVFDCKGTLSSHEEAATASTQEPAVDWEPVNPKDLPGYPKPLLEPIQAPEKNNTNNEQDFIQGKLSEKLKAETIHEPGKDLPANGKISGETIIPQADSRVSISLTSPPMASSAPASSKMMIAVEHVQVASEKPDFLHPEKHDVLKEKELPPTLTTINRSTEFLEAGPKLALSQTKDRRNATHNKSMLENPEARATGSSSTDNFIHKTGGKSTTTLPADLKPASTNKLVDTGLGNQHQMVTEAQEGHENAGNLKSLSGEEKKDNKDSLQSSGSNRNLQPMADERNGNGGGGSDQELRMLKPEWELRRKRSYISAQAVGGIPLTQLPSSQVLVCGTYERWNNSACTVSAYKVSFLQCTMKMSSSDKMADIRINKSPDAPSKDKDMNGPIKVPPSFSATRDKIYRSAENDTADMTLGLTIALGLMGIIIVVSVVVILAYRASRPRSSVASERDQGAQHNIRSVQVQACRKKCPAPTK